MPSFLPWFRGDATALAAAIVRGEVSAVAALERTLADVHAANERLNFVALLDAGLGAQRAAALDAELAACRDDAARAALLAARPFFGVPLLLKDLGASTAHHALPMRWGSRLFPHGQRSGGDAELTRRYLAAGFVPFGRTTTPEMGISASTEALAYGGPTRNPWHPEHSAGGSSGGAAAALASGAVTIAHASDGAGSIRIPASACGLIGLKPSRGLVPCGPFTGEGWGGLTIDHVLTRSVHDCAAALDATAGADAGAPYAAPPAGAFVRTLPVRPRGLRIALVDTFYEGDPVEPQVADAVRGFARALERLGHRVERVRLPFTTHDVVRPVMQLVAAGTAAALEQIAAARGRPIGEGEVEPVVYGALRVGRGIGAIEYLNAEQSLQMLGRRLGALHEHHDLLLTPTLAEPPAVLGRFAMRDPDFIDYRLGPQGLWRYTPFTPLANATGAPAISLPVGRAANGTPIGAMLAAPLGGDALLLRVAAQCEDAGLLLRPAFAAAAG